MSNNEDKGFLAVAIIGIALAIGLTIMTGTPLILECGVNTGC